MHYYQFHIGDYRAGTIHLTQLERWVYRDLLDCLYDTEDDLPLDIDQVCMMVGARSEEHKEAVRIVLSQKFIKTEDGYTNERFIQELSKYRSKARRAIDANKKRWGLDNDLKSDLKSDADQIPTNNHKPITNKKIMQPPEGVAVEVWEDFLVLRKAKKSPVTQTALNAIKREADKANMSLDQVLQIMCNRGWTGFKADWLKGFTSQVSSSTMFSDQFAGTLVDES